MRTQERESGFFIVSGGSRGLGHSIVGHLLERGVSVATFSRTGSEGLGQLSENYPNRLFSMNIDAGSPDEIDRFVHSIPSALGMVRGLVNNAAIGQDQLLSDIPVERIREILEVNLVSVVLLTRAVVRRLLLEGSSGRIVTVTSVAARIGTPGLTVYSAAKAGLEAFSRSLARELTSRRILVNAVAPGYFPSELSEPLRADRAEKSAGRRSPRPLTLPSHILPVLDLLLFGDSNISGQTIVVDGGGGA